MADEPSTTDDPNNPEVEPEEQPTDPAAATPAAPSAGVTLSEDQFERMMAGIGSMSQAVQQMQQAGAAPPPAPPIPEITDDQIAAAVDDGDTAKAMRLMETRMMRRFEGALGQFEQRGLGILNQVTTQVTRSQMPHYARFKDEIEAQLSSLDPALRASPDAQMMAYRLVIGAHAEELTAEAVQAAQREAATTPAADPAGGTGSRSDVRRDPDVPTLEEAYGAEVAQAVSANGDTPDSWAQKQGYADWPTFYKETELPSEGDVQ